MKKVISLFLVISMIIVNMGTVFADENIEMSNSENEVINETEINNEKTVEGLDIAEVDLEEKTEQQETPIDNEKAAEVDSISEITDPLEEKLNEYLASFPENSPDKEMFMREIELIKYTDSYNEEEIDKLYERFKPIDISSLPEIVPVEIPEDDWQFDESSVIRISEEERIQNEEENQRLLDWYAEMMEGMSDEEAVELGINEEIIELVRLKELQELEEPLNTAQVQNISLERQAVNVMSAPKSLSSSANTTSKAPMIASGDYHNVYLKGDGTVWTWGNYNADATLKQTMNIYNIKIRRIK